MKLIIDPGSINSTDSIKVSPNRLYFCENHKINWTRTQVRKDRNGVYHCPRCDAALREITDTDDGQQLTTILGL